MSRAVTLGDKIADLCRLPAPQKIALAKAMLRSCPDEERYAALSDLGRVVEQPAPTPAARRYGDTSLQAFLYGAVAGAGVMFLIYAVGSWHR